MKRIIINADDFGSRPSVNQAIVKLLTEGTIDSTTVMANMPGFKEAIQLAHDNKLTSRIGVHLVLTAGEPLTEEIKSIPYLFKEDSREVCVKKLFLMSKHLRNLVYKEFSKQIEEVKRNGIQITHLDTHKHMHDVWGISHILMELLKTYNIPRMRILLNLEKTKSYKNAYRTILNNYLKLRNVNYSDYLGSQMDYQFALQRNPHFAKNKIVEIMVHPDFNSKGQLIDLFPTKEYDFDFAKVK